MTGTNGTTGRSRAVSGPTFKLDQPMPCGCRVTKDPDGKLRLLYCRTHLAAFETLEALQSAARAIDRLAPGGSSDVEVEDTRFAVRSAIHRARPREPW